MAEAYRVKGFKCPECGGSNFQLDTGACSSLIGGEPAMQLRSGVCLDCDTRFENIHDHAEGVEFYNRTGCGTVSTDEAVAGALARIVR